MRQWSNKTNQSNRSRLEDSKGGGAELIVCAVAVGDFSLSVCVCVCAQGCGRPPLPACVHPRTDLAGPLARLLVERLGGCQNGLIDGLVGGHQQQLGLIVILTIGKLIFVVCLPLLYRLFLLGLGVAGPGGGAGGVGEGWRRLQFGGRKKGGENNGSGGGGERGGREGGKQGRKESFI